MVAARPDINRSFYGKEVAAGELLSGKEPQPTAAQPLYTALEQAMQSPANSVNRFASTSGRLSSSGSIPYAIPTTTAAPPPSSDVSL